MALDIKPTRSELINLKRRIKQTSTGYNLLKMKRDLSLIHISEPTRPERITSQYLTSSTQPTLKERN